MPTNTKNSTEITKVEEAAGKEAKIQPLSREAMKLNVWLKVGESGLTKWADLVTESEQKGSSLTLGEFAAKLGLDESAAQFMVSDEGGLHRSQLPIYALSNLSSKRKHLLTANEIRELVSMVKLNGKTCAACKKDVPEELVSPVVDWKNTGFFKFRDDGDMMMKGQCFKVEDRQGNTTIREVRVFCKSHVRDGGNAHKRAPLPYSIAADIIQRVDKDRQAGESYVAANSRPDNRYGNSGTRQSRRDNDEDGGDGGNNRNNGGGRRNGGGRY